MSVKQRIDQDLKSALLGGDKTLATTLRGLKSAILYAEVASGKREAGLDDESITVILQKEAKKRQESAELFERGGNSEKAAAELEELRVIKGYLPEMVSEDEIEKAVGEAIASLGAQSVKDMGRVIAAVKEKVGNRGDGAMIAKITKEKLQ